MPFSSTIESHISQHAIPPYTPFQLPHLQFHHILAPIPPSATLPDLYKCYTNAMALALGSDGIAKLNAVDTAFEDFTDAPGSNLMLTQRYLYIVPRSDPRPGLHIHSMGLSGLLVATTEEEVAVIKRGAMGLLTRGGIAKRAVGGKL
jgi:ATP adenylyltransferase/5',5'''-P-1,P-4-tetraphosphate phosphorylase II